MLSEANKIGSDGFGSSIITGGSGSFSLGFGFEWKLINFVKRDSSLGGSGVRGSSKFSSMASDLIVSSVLTSVLMIFSAWMDSVLHSLSISFSYVIIFSRTDSIFSLTFFSNLSFVFSDSAGNVFCDLIEMLVSFFIWSVSVT